MIRAQNSKNELLDPSRFLPGFSLSRTTWVSSMICAHVFSQVSSIRGVDPIVVNFLVSIIPHASKTLDKLSLAGTNRIPGGLESARL